MTEEEVKKIVEKYGNDYSRLSKEATNKEYKTVLNFIVKEANHKQRVVAGLDKED